MAAGVTGRFFPTHGHHLGAAGNYRTYNESTLNAGGQGPFLGHLGQMVEDSGKVFRLVQYKKGTAGVATIDGGVVYWLGKANFQVTPDVAGSTIEGTTNGMAGGTNVAIATSADGNYMYVQCGGDQAAVVVGAGAVNGDMLLGQATNNVLARLANGGTVTGDVYGIALTTRGTTTSDSGNSVSNSSGVRWNLGAFL